MEEPEKMDPRTKLIRSSIPQQTSSIPAETHFPYHLLRPFFCLLLTPIFLLLQRRKRIELTDDLGFRDHLLQFLHGLSWAALMSTEKAIVEELENHIHEKSRDIADERGKPGPGEEISGLELVYSDINVRIYWIRD